MKLPAWLCLILQTRLLVHVPDDDGSLDLVAQWQIEGHVPRPYRWMRRQVRR